MILPSTNPKRSFILVFAARALLVVITVILLDLAIGSLLKTFYFRQKSGLQYRTTYALESANADLLIFGSSEAIHDYIPDIFEDRMNLSAYSVGRDGNSIFYDYAVLKAVLKRYTPKIIILDFDNHEFTRSAESYDRLACLLPYYEKHPEIDSIVDLRGPYEKYKLVSHIYPYNSALFTIAVGNTEFNRAGQADRKGYVPLSDTWQRTMEDGSSFVNRPLDSNKIRVYESFIQTCVAANIELYIAAPPVFIRPNYSSSSVELGKEIAAKYKVKFLDYSKDHDILAKPNFFADILHLNDAGASEFSNRVVNSIIGERNEMMEANKNPSRPVPANSTDDSKGTHAKLPDS